MEEGHSVSNQQPSGCKVTIYIWKTIDIPPYQHMGHASLQLDLPDGTRHYLSWWPDKGKTLLEKVKTLLMGGSVRMPPGYDKSNSYQDPQRRWHHSDTVLTCEIPAAGVARSLWKERFAHQVYEFDDWPDCQALLDYLTKQEQEVQARTAQYHVLTKNCAWAVGQALKAGGAETFKPVPFRSRLHVRLLKRYCDKLYDEYKGSKRRCP